MEHDISCDSEMPTRMRSHKLLLRGCLKYVIHQRLGLGSWFVFFSKMQTNAERGISLEGYYSSEFILDYEGAKADQNASGCRSIDPT